MRAAEPAAPTGSSKRATSKTADAKSAVASSGDSIRSIDRALRILQAMNLRQQWSLHELQLAVALPKTTVFRILQTLERSGFVRSEGTLGLYRLGEKVKELSSGYTDKDLVIEVGSPIALKITKEIKWPLAIATLDGTAMRVRYSTMPYSPLAVHATTVGQRLPLLETATGRVYLAFCSERERNELFAMLREASPEKTLGDEKRLDAELEMIRRKGCGIRKASPQRQTATIAAPIMHGSDVVASLSMTTFGKSLTPELVARYSPVIIETAELIAQAYIAKAGQ